MHQAIDAAWWIDHERFYGVHQAIDAAWWIDHECFYANPDLRNAGALLHKGMEMTEDGNHTPSLPLMMEGREGPWGLSRMTVF